MNQSTDPETITTIKHLHNDLINSSAFSNCSLLGGESGVCLSLAAYYHVFPDEASLEYITISIQRQLERIQNFPNTTQLSGELVGFAYLLSFIQGNTIFPSDFGSVLEDINEVLYTYFKECDVNKVHDLDYLHGLTGTIMFLILTNSKYLEPCTQKYIDILERQLVAFPTGIAWQFTNRIDNTTGYNLSISHGLSAIICLLSELAYREIMLDKTMLLLNRAAAFLFDHIPDQPYEKCFFGNFAAINEAKSVSRLGWCYGDLGCFWSLIKASAALKNASMLRKSLTALEVVAERKMADKYTLVKDTGLCHGSAGIAVFFSNLFKLTSNPIFKTSSEYWKDVTLSNNFSGLPTGFNKFQTFKDGSYYDNLGLLEGKAGVLLALLELEFSIPKSNFPWEGFLSINIDKLNKLNFEC